MATRLISSDISDPNLTSFSESDFSAYSRADSFYPEQVTDWDEDTSCESLDDKTFLITLKSTSNLFESTPNQNLELEPPPAIAFEKTPLAAPIFNHDVTKLMEVLKTVACRRDTVDFQGRTALHMACMLGNKEVVQLLLDNGWSRVARTQHLRTPLHEATICGHHQVISLLAEKKSDELNAADRYGLSPIHFAALHGEVLCLKVLVRAECKSSLKDLYGRLPTHLAAGRGHLNALKLLYESGFVMDNKDNEGRLPTHYSAESGRIDCLRYLNSNGISLVSTDADGWKPIHTAASTDQLACLKYLLTHGSEIYDSDKQGRSVAHIATIHGSIKCLHWILEQSVSPDVKDNAQNSLAHLASHRGNDSCINCIYHHGGAMMSQNSFGLTPLQIAQNNGKVSNWKNGMSGQNSCILCRQKREKNTEFQVNKKRNIHATIQDYSQQLFSLDKVVEGTRYREGNSQLGKPRIPEGRHKILTKNGDNCEQTWLKINLEAIYYGQNN